MYADWFSSSVIYCSLFVPRPPSFDTCSITCMDQTVNKAIGVGIYSFEIQMQPVSPALAYSVGTTLTTSPLGVATRFVVVRSDAPAG